MDMLLYNMLGLCKSVSHDTIKLEVYILLLSSLDLLSCTISLGFGTIESAGQDIHNSKTTGIGLQQLKCETKGERELIPTRGDHDHRLTAHRLKKPTQKKRNTEHAD
ncbi:uncharacterized protein M6G45_015241 isoform 1-T1 [Spheniscus humboldti]